MERKLGELGFQEPQGEREPEPLAEAASGAWGSPGRADACIEDAG